MDITSEFHLCCYEIFKRDKQTKNETEIEELFELEKKPQEEKHTFKKFITELEKEIDEKTKLNNQINYDVLIGKIDINTFSQQQYFGEQMNQWAREKNELLKKEYERYIKENKNKKFNIDHYKIVVVHVELEFDLVVGILFLSLNHL